MTISPLASIMATAPRLSLDGLDHPPDAPDYAPARTALETHAVLIETLAAWLRWNVRESRTYRPADQLRHALEDVWSSYAGGPRRVPTGVWLAITIAAGYQWRRQGGRVFVALNGSDLRGLEARPGAKYADVGR